MHYKRINTWAGWLAFLIAFITYYLTAERTASFWDCGEFISASYKLQVVHPPGAPLFLMLGRLFSMFATDITQVGLAVNMLSVVTSALCVLFTFWTITHFAKKMLAPETEPEKSQLISIIGAGLAGALSLTFTDTFWFSAVEAEVYASSSFFTALTFWCILKWEHIADRKYADRWLVLIAYLIGLGIGVHLLNLLVIPAIVYVYYFKRYDFSRAGFIKATLAAMGILLFVQVGVIPGIPALAASFDLYFVNSLGMGFGSGVIFFAVLLVTAIVAGLWYTIKTQKVWLNTAILCFAFVVIGYASYSMAVIRSLANPPIDMNNPEEPFNFLSYINREQYGDRPLLYGPYFNAKVTDSKVVGTDHRKGENTYEVAGDKLEAIYDQRYMTFFPRMGDQQKASSPGGYKYWSGAARDKVPSFGQNLKFFFSYQLGYMYWRYFLWNFAGRQSDVQGDGDPVNGNWLTGIGFLDNMRLGPQSNLPDQMQHNKGRNTYFMLPLILGLMGLIFQYQVRRNDFFINVVLFLFTGILIAIYLNAPPYEPRERDYTLVGSFQIFCIWIGLGVLQLADWLNKKINKTTAAIAATLLALAISPLLLASQNWDDHDRSQRRMVTSFARNYLETCAPNAILFTNGDNDTYPLWYAQNVEGVRTDVRVVNLQLLNFDWYARDLTRKIYDSEPFKLSMTPNMYVKGVREQTYFYENPQLRLDANEYYPLKDIIAFITNENDPRAKVSLRNGSMVNYLPTKNLLMNINKEQVLANGTVAPEDSAFVVNTMRFKLPGNGLMKSELVLLDLIAANNWERPIYFASNSVDQNLLGLGEYFQLEGLAYRLVPAKRPPQPGLPFNVNERILYNNLVNKYEFGGINQPGMLLDEQIYRMTGTMRNFYSLDATLLMQKGMKDSAVKALDYCLEQIPAEVLPMEYIQLVTAFAQSYYGAGQKEKALQVINGFVKDQEQKAAYFRQYRETAKFRQVEDSYKRSLDNLSQIALFTTSLGETALGKEIENKYQNLSK